jgi:hypothetical protein
MTTQRIFASRTRHETSTYIGNKGTLFYDEVDGELRLSNGVTPGGVAISVRADLITAQRLTPGADNNIAYGLGDETHRWYDLHIGDGGIHFDSVATPQTVPFLPSALPAPLLPAGDNTTDLGDPTHRFRNLYLGPASLYIADSSNPSVNVDISVNSGTLYIAGAQNLAVGALVIKDTTLTTITPSTNISIGDPADTGLAIIGRRTVITTPTVSGYTSALLINGSTTLPVDPSPLLFDGVQLHMVANAGRRSRIIQDAFGVDQVPSVTGRFSRGTIASPAAVQNGDALYRISGHGHDGTTFPTVGDVRVDLTAIETFTSSHRGTRIDFWTTPAGSNVVTNSASVTGEGFVGNGYTFTGDNTRQTTAGIPLSAKGVTSATYVATLGIDGKLDASQIPSSLSGAVVFKGGWNATANTPSLSNGSGTDGWEYAITTGGTRTLGTQTGSVTYVAGGFVIYGNNIWNYTPPFNNITYVTASVGTHVKINGNQGTQEVGIINVTSDATPNASTSTIVSRDASGNFSANMITANLTGAVTGSVSGNAGSVTNGVYTSGDQNINGTKTFFSTIQGTITTATFASSFNTGTLVTQAVSATTATNAAYAYSFNTGTLVTQAVSATTAITAKSATTATNLAVATSLFAGKLSAATGSIPKNSLATVTYTVTGLTTNHKIIITPGTVMPDRAFSVTAAWVSGADTISIQYANNTGGAISVTLDINYFAFV